MTRALSDDLRKRVIAAVDSGMSCRAAAERFGLGVSTAIKWVRRWRETDRWTAKRSGGDVRSHRIDAFRDEILALVKTTPDITLAEIAGHLDRAYGVQLALSTVFRFFRRHGVTYKKRRRTLPNKIGPM
jgi:transposase